MEISFRPIILESRSEIVRYTFSGLYRNCDFAFANMYSWQFLYGSEYAVVEDTLFVRFYIDNHRPAYMIPQGALPLQDSIEMLQADARNLGHALCLLGISEEGRTALNEAFPERFRFVVERDYADYIYLREDLATLSGKRYQSKRNHINQFVKKYPDYRYLPLTPELVPECLRFGKLWLDGSQPEYAEGLSNERQAITRALAHFDELGLQGGTLWVGDKMVAFTYGSPITRDTFGVHVEKADASVDGAYTMINREFARSIPGSYVYVNREEDLGIPGLRQAKLSYQPFRLQEKMAAFYSHSETKDKEEVLPGSTAVSDPLILRRATSADKSAVMDLWQTCFHDDPRFLELFFSRKFSPDRCCVVVRGERLCAALQHLPYTLSLWGGEEPMSYWAGLSTYPEERGRGFMGALMTHAFTLLCRRGFLLVSLIPAEKSLYDYYGRFGFETAFYCRKYLYEINGVLPASDAVLDNTFDSEWLSGEWCRLTMAYSCRVLHDTDDFDVVRTDVRLAGGDVWVTSVAGTATAVAVVVPRGDSLIILDICADGEMAMAGIISALCRRYSPRRLSLSLPDGSEVGEILPSLLSGIALKSSEREASGMTRIVDAETLLGRYADAYPNRTHTIRLRDDLLPSNSGIYTIKEGRSGKQPLSLSGTDTVCDYDFDVRALTRWLFLEKIDTAPYMSLMLSE